MKKLALVFVLAVFAPSLVLAWLAIRSARDQQFIMERQQALLYQGVADNFARAVQEQVADQQREFRLAVEEILQGTALSGVENGFDEKIRSRWTLAEVGFAVSTEGAILSPSLFGNPEARRFRLENDQFLSNRETVEVYWNNQNNRAQDQPGMVGPNLTQRYGLESSSQSRKSLSSQRQLPAYENQSASNLQTLKRAVAPQKAPDEQPASRASATEAEFRQLVGNADEGTVARFLQNRLKLLFWRRPSPETGTIFGAQINLAKMSDRLRGVLEAQPPLDPVLRKDICIALLDDLGRPVMRSEPGFAGDWKHPFVATEIGDVLPHWEAAVYLLDPRRISENAHSLAWTLGVLVLLLVAAIGIGGWLIVTDLRRQLALARQKTDFVSNVSHELKTPLTSIRMFSEILSEGRVKDPARQQTYLGIIAAETARLTRLINNVLDFARMERGEKKYHWQRLELNELAERTLSSYRPQLESAGFLVEYRPAEEPLWVRGESDALAQVLVNLISNAEKYSDAKKEILLRTEARPRKVLLHVEDRGAGVPIGSEEKIFEQFYRAHDSLSSGVQGSGLGLTLARQIVRTHGGDITYAPREGGGSRFTVELPRENMQNQPAKIDAPETS